jgi:hypothetical protein
LLQFSSHCPMTIHRRSRADGCVNVAKGIRHASQFERQRRVGDSSILTRDT